MQSASHLQGKKCKKACPTLASVCPTNTKKITAVLLANSALSREPVQRLIDLAKKMCIYCIAASVQHACTGLKIIIKMCFLL